MAFSITLSREVEKYLTFDRLVVPVIGFFRCYENIFRIPYPAPQMVVSLINGSYLHGRELPKSIISMRGLRKIQTRSKLHTYLRKKFLCDHSNLLLLLGKQGSTLLICFINQSFDFSV